MRNQYLKLRLSVLSFLEFAVFGAYLASMGNYLGNAGMGDDMSLFYAIQGVAAILMPTILGVVADKWVPSQKLMGICHLVAGIGMILMFTMGQLSPTPNELLFTALYTVSIFAYMPTIALLNTTSFIIFKDQGKDPVKEFPLVRTFGPVGFFVSMWFVNCATWENGTFALTLGESAFKFQYTHFQFLVSGILGILLYLYNFTLPACSMVKQDQHVTSQDVLGLSAFKLFKSPKLAIIFVFSGLLGMSSQVANCYATPFLTSFKANPILADTFAANNATLLVSISQFSEALCILLIPFFLRRYGFKIVMLMSLTAWMLSFCFFGLGSPAFPGVCLFIASCLIYGLAFDFYNVAGGLYVDQNCAPEMRASAQGMFSLMTDGLGSSIGIVIAGEIINGFCQWEGGYLVGDWQTCWFIFAGYSLLLMIAFAIVFKTRQRKKSVTYTSN